jgi:hypothetical protein
MSNVKVATKTGIKVHHVQAQVVHKHTLAGEHHSHVFPEHGHDSAGHGFHGGPRQGHPGKGDNKAKGHK